MNNLTVIAAYWGAIIATMAMVWNIVTWVRDRPRLNILDRWATTVGQAGNTTQYECTLRLVNMGKSPLSIARCLVAEVSFEKRRRHRAVSLHDVGKLPVALGPGEFWEGLVRRGPDSYAPKEYLLFFVETGSGKRIRRFARFEKSWIERRFLR